MQTAETLPAATKPIINDILNDKEELFCREYVIDKNGTQAIIRAGYSKKTAEVKASQKLRLVKVRNRIKELLAQKHEELDISQERILKEYSRIAFHNPKDFYKEDGTLKKITELDDDTAAAITGFDVTNIGEVGTLTKIKMSDKHKALDSLAKTFDMFGESGAQEIEAHVQIESKDVAMRIAFLLKKADK